MRFEGRCHCGNLEVTFETPQPPGALALRECGCTFCRRHGALAVTDPAGSLEVRARDAGEVTRYRFGLRTADFLVCRTCGEAFRSERVEWSRRGGSCRRGGDEALSALGTVDATTGSGPA